MTADYSARVSRRAVVTALVGLPLGVGVLGSCAALSPASRASSLAPVPDADARLRWRSLRLERDLAALVPAVVAAHPSLGSVLTPLAEHHRAHVTALRDEGPFPRLTDPSMDAPAPEVPTAVADAVAAVIDAERAASEVHLAACGACQGPRLATVLASIAASDAGMAALVGSS